MTMHRARNLAQAEEMIKEMKEFTMPSGTVHAFAVWNGARGKLPDEEVTEALRRAVYVVFSYETPIAWVAEDGTKIIPDVGFSLTTSQHQYMVANAWKIRFNPKRGRTVVRAGGGPRRGGVDD